MDGHTWEYRTVASRFPRGTTVGQRKILDQKVAGLKAARNILLLG